MRSEKEQTKHGYKCMMKRGLRIKLEVRYAEMYKGVVIWQLISDEKWDKEES